ncbi:MAG: seg [Parcubacteria group bacterium]|nr:seg [Parcubacteria group bacterium]
MQRLSLLVLALLIFGALPIHAQEIGADPLTVSISPQYPKPFDTITVTPGSTLLDLPSSSVTISANGSVVQKGSGTQAAAVRVGAAGTRTTILVTVITPDGQSHAKQVTIRPADVSLILEPSSTVPPFYKGASLVASEGRVRIVAIPDIRNDANVRLSPSSLVYMWRLGDQILQSSSGIGKSVLSATAPVRYRDTVVTVTVSTVDSSIVAEQSVVVAPADPVVRIYRNDPLLGPLFGAALSGTYSMADTETTFRAVPYFFGAPPNIAWTVGGSMSGEDKDLTVRATGNGAGTSAVSVSAKHPDFHQTAQGGFSVKFGASKGLGIFGL